MELEERIMERKRILHIRDSGGLFGGESVILTLAKNIDRSLFHMKLLCMRRPDGRSEPFIAAARETGIDVDILDVRGRFDHRAISNLRSYLKKNRIELIHTHDFKSDFYGLISACSLDIRKISTAHGSTRDSLLKRLYLLFDEQIVYRCFDRIIAVSEDLRARLSSKLIPRDRIELIQNGVDMDLLDRRDGGSDVDIELPAEPETKVFAVIGRLYPDKGHALFLEAFAQLARDHKDVFCVIVGDGPERESINKRIKASGLGRKAFCCGAVRDIKRIYDSTDYLVIPSLTEGLPYVLLEAMGSGIPVLATSVGDIPLLIRDGHTGFLVPPGDIESLARGMEDLVSMPEQAHLMAERGRRLVEDHYLAAGMVKKTEALYLSLLS